MSLPIITLPEIEIALSELNITPCRGCWISYDEKSSCALGCLYRKRCNDLDTEPEDQDFWAWARELYGNDYVTGFWIGFDSALDEEENPYTIENERCRLGYQHGQEIAKALGPKIRSFTRF